MQFDNNQIHTLMRHGLYTKEMEGRIIDCDYNTKTVIIEYNGEIIEKELCEAYSHVIPFGCDK